MRLGDYIVNTLKTPVFESHIINEGLSDIFGGFFGEFTFSDSFKSWKDSMKEKRDAQLALKKKAIERKKKLKDQQLEMKKKMKEALTNLKEKQKDAILNSQIATMKARISEFQSRMKSVENIIGKSNALDPKVLDRIVNDASRQIDGLPAEEKSEAEKMNEKIVMYRYKIGDDGKPIDVGKAAIKAFETEPEKIGDFLKSQYGMTDEQVAEFNRKMNDVNNTEYTGTEEEKKAAREAAQKQLVAETACNHNFVQNYSKAHSKEEAEKAMEDMAKRSKEYTKNIATNDEAAQRFLMTEEEADYEVKKAKAETAEKLQAQGKAYVQAKEKYNKINSLIDEYYDEDHNLKDGKSEDEIKEKLRELGIEVPEGQNVSEFVNQGPLKDAKDEMDGAKSSLEAVFPRKEGDTSGSLPDGVCENNDIENLTEKALDDYAKKTREEAEAAKEDADASKEIEKENIAKVLKSATDTKKPVTDKDVDDLAKEMNIETDDNSWMTDEQKEEYNKIVNDPKFKGGKDPEGLAEATSEFMKKARSEMKEPEEPNFTLKVDNSVDPPKYYKVSSDGNGEEHTQELSEEELKNAIKEKKEYRARRDAYDRGQNDKGEISDKEQKKLETERDEKIKNLDKEYEGAKAPSEDESLAIEVEVENESGEKVKKKISLFDKDGEPKAAEDIKKELEAAGVSENDIKNYVQENDGTLELNGEAKTAVENAKKDGSPLDKWKKKKKAEEAIRGEYEEKIGALEDARYSTRATDDEMEDDVNNADDEEEDPNNPDEKDSSGKPKAPAKWTKRTNSKTKTVSYYDENGNRMGSIKSEKVRKHLAAVKRYRKRLAEWEEEHSGNESLLSYSLRKLILS